MSNLRMLTRAVVTAGSAAFVGWAEEAPVRKTAEDLLEFADHIFFGKPLSNAFGKRAYPVEQPDSSRQQQSVKCS